MLRNLSLFVLLGLLFLLQLGWRIATLKRAAPSALKVFEHLQQKVMRSTPQLAAMLELSQPTVTASLKHLEKLGIAKEASGKKKDRLFVYSDYLKLLSVDIEPL